MEPALEDEPDTAGGNVANLLDEAEDVVNAVVPDTRREVQLERERASASPWRRALRRFGRRGPSRPSSGSADGFGGSRGGQ